ncbi:MAG: flagellar biosynthesis protein FlhB [Polyangiales bacterium]
MAERTHLPTAKKLREARTQGNVPRAPLVAGALGLLASLALVGPAIRALAGRLSASLVHLAPVEQVDPWALGGEVVTIVAPVALALIAVAVLSGIATGGLAFSPSKLAPDPSRLDPFAGLRNLVDRSRLWGAARGLAILVVLTWALGGVLLGVVREASHLGDGAARALDLAARAASKVATTTAMIALLFAVVDALVARKTWLAKLMMTREEVVREHEEGEGDPELKRRREELHHELLAGEAIRAVREATVVVVNPTHLACALRYRGDGGEDEAPTLVAKGHGALAARMIEAARAWGVPIVRDVPVARALHELEIGTEIPDALYEAVAEVLRAAGDDAPE